MDVSPPNHPTVFSTICNFRDVGGHTADGRTVRRRRLYRSDSLHRIDDVDRAAFTELGIRTVIDLRRPHEVARDGRVSRTFGLDYLHIHPDHAEWELTPYDERDNVARYLADRYLDLAATGSAGIARVVGVIADTSAAPVVVHCVAGKDRTGVVCALTLAALGVADADIAADYALSNDAVARFTTWVRSTLPAAAALPPPFLSAPAEAMLLFLTGLRERHGSVERYLGASGLTAGQLTALRDHLLT